jgi:UDP-N-acetylglucosamine transferase subunit ALG13
MILVTLGTIPFPFDRAIQWLHVLLDRGIIAETVFVQYGSSSAALLRDNELVTLVPWVESSKLSSLVDSARLVISHAGQGSTRMLASRGARFILIPRLKKFSEHVDDHQLWFCQGLAPLDIFYCLSISDLEKSIRHPPQPLSQKLFDGPKLADHLLKVHPP